MRAVQITQFGGPEVLRVVDIAPPVPRDGQVLIDVHAAGVNYADTHQIEDSYLSPQRLPLVPGAEVVGIARGGELDGRRVAALTLAGGGYAAQAVARPGSVFALPDDVDDATALALILQGTTAWHLLRTCGRLDVGETVVVHAAAGGVGTIALQLAAQWGAGRIIASASSADKRELALRLGADVAVDVSTTRTAQEVTAMLVEAGGGRGVDIVLEMTGGHVADGSLEALAPWGRLVTYGEASRTHATPVLPAALMATSRSIIGFWLVHAVGLPDGLGPAMEELLSLVGAGRLHPVVGGSYPLEDAARAHRDLLSRTTTGKLVLTLDEAAFLGSEVAPSSS